LVGEYRDHLGRRRGEVRTFPKDTVYVPGANLAQSSPQSVIGMPFTEICDGTAGEVCTRSSPWPSEGQGAPMLTVNVPVMTLVCPATTFACWHNGVLNPCTAPKQIWYEPTGRSVHIPQSFLGTPSIEIVDGTGGEVTTRKFPRWTNMPWTVVTLPAVTVTVWGRVS
jgi:hypothetical protein